MFAGARRERRFLPQRVDELDLAAVGVGEAAHDSLPLGVPESGLPALRRGKRPEDVLARIIPKGQIAAAVVDEPDKAPFMPCSSVPAMNTTLP